MHNEEKKGHAKTANAYYGSDIVRIKTQRYQEAYDYNAVGVTYHNWKDYKAAITCYKKSIESYPKYVNAYHNLGNAYYQLKDYKTAITFYEQAIEIDSKYVHSHYGLGFAYHDAKDYKKAIIFYKRVLEIDQESSDNKESSERSKIAYKGIAKSFLLYANTSNVDKGPCLVHSVKFYLKTGTNAALLYPIYLRLSILFVQNCH